ncbi:MAG: type VI secretion system-associated FHA domain protein TagH [Sedimentitalea sp.]
MPVTLKFQSSGTVPGNAQPVQMQGGSLTVGRGPANDMVLPDPDRLLSKSHCVLEDHSGQILIVDLSTNGTFLNYSKIPLGRDPTSLNNGDVLALGAYELVVEISESHPDLDALIAASSPSMAAPLIPPPLEADNVSPGLAANAPDPLALLDDAAPGGDFLDDLLGSEGGPTGPSQLNPVDPIDELLPPMGDDDDPFFNAPSDGREGDGSSFGMHNPSASDSFAPPTPSQSLIPDDWDPLFGDAPPKAEAKPAPLPETLPPTGPRVRTPPVTQNPPAQPDFSTQPGLPAETVPPTAPAKAGQAANSDAARAFLEAVGAQDVQISDADLTSTMARMGRVMKTLVTGLREILMTRTSIKSEFRIEQTMISSGGNNPLKFSFSVEQAIETMVRPASKGYLGPETAAEQALDDIKAHEIAMVTGMEAALKGVLAKLNPEVLAGQIETSNAFGSLLRGKKARYWEVYEKIYAEISDQAENDFHDLFSREFARAYKDQLDKLKHRA